MPCPDGAWTGEARLGGVSPGSVSQGSLLRRKRRKSECVALRLGWIWLVMDSLGVSCRGMVWHGDADGTRSVGRNDD